MDNSTTIQQLKDSVEQFKFDRNWGQYAATKGGGNNKHQAPNSK